MGTYLFTVTAALVAGALTFSQGRPEVELQINERNMTVINAKYVCDHREGDRVILKCVSNCGTTKDDLRSHPLSLDCVDCCPNMKGKK